MVPDPLDKARAARAQGEVVRATSHIAMALEENPSDPEALALLSELVAESDTPLSLAPLGNPVTFLELLLHSRILGLLGRTEDALKVLFEATLARPHVPALAWGTGWVAEDEALARVDPELVAGFLARLCDWVPGLVAGDAQTRALFERAEEIAERTRQLHPDHLPLLIWSAAVARKAARLDAALSRALEAYGRAASWDTAIAVALTHRARGEVEPAVEAYHAALSFRPDALSARLELGDMLCENERLEEGLHHYDVVLRGEPSHPWALPSALYARWLLTGDERWAERLHVLADANPDNRRATNLRSELRALVDPPWVGYLPEPSDATVNAVKQIVRDLEHSPPTGDRPPVTVALRLNALECPSSRLAAGMAFASLRWNVVVEFTVENIQQPDPREPRGEVAYRLWRYDGDDPQRAMPPPPAAVAAAVADLADTTYHLSDWARGAATAAKEIRWPDDVLRVMIYPPSPRSGMPAAIWLQRIQVAAALIIAEGTWPSATPFRILDAIARGPEDWSVGAAAVALAHLAVTGRHAEPEVRATLEHAYAERPRWGHCAFEHAVVCSLLRLPSLAAEERTTLEQARAALEKAVDS